jgi:hypothetical protein
MNDAEKQSRAWARLVAIRDHPPLSWDESAVSDFNEIVTALEEAYDAIDLSVFRVPDTQMKRRIVSVQRAPRSGRFPGQVQLSGKRYCDEQFVIRQLEGILLYFQNQHPPPDRQRFGF